MKYKIAAALLLIPLLHLHAAEISVKSLSGAPEDFSDNRLPEPMETRVASNILLIDQRTVEARTGNNNTRSTTNSAFSVTEGTGFSLVQVTSSYPNFGPSSITGPNGAVYHFNGSVITCNSGPCDLDQADIQMEAFTDRPGGVMVFSISGGEAVPGSWGLSISDPLELRSTVQMDSMISYDENVVEIVIGPIECDDNSPICPDPCPPGEPCIEPMLGLTEGSAAKLSVFASTTNDNGKSKIQPIDINKLQLTVVSSDTRQTIHTESYDAARATSLPLNANGFSQLRLPALPSGKYSVRIDVEGEVEGIGSIERTAFYFLPIIEKKYQLAQAVQTQVVDNNRLKINLSLASFVNQHSHVYAYAEVWSATTNKPIAWIGGMTYPETDRNNAVSIPLMFDSRWLALAGETGHDYVLRNIRIQDPHTFIPIDQLAELSMTVSQLPPKAYLSRAEVIIDDSLYYGKRDISIPVQALAPDPVNRGAIGPFGILLVHGWCSNPAWPAGDFFNGNPGGTAVFSDPLTSRSHDAFAQRIRTQGDMFFTDSFSVVAHSQGGAAATHLRAFYNSGLDNSQAPRPIQTMGTPYGGSTLMDLYVASGPLGWLIGIIITGGCEPQFSLTTLGSVLWRSSIPNHIRDDVYFYRTRHRRPSNFIQRLQFWRWNCKITSYVIPRSDDGVVSHVQGRFSGANDMGITDRECHTDNMKYNDQKDNAARNLIMDFEGRPPPPPPLNARCFVDWIWHTGGPDGNGYFEYWVDASNSVAGAFPITSYTWINDGATGNPTSNDRFGPLFPGLPGQASSYVIQVRVTDTSGDSDTATCWVP